MGRSRGKPRQPNGYVYLVFNPDNGLHKIGVSASPEARMDSINSDEGVKCELIHLIPSNDVYRLERSLHAQHGEQRVRGEWFNLTAGQVASIKARAEVIYTGVVGAKRKPAADKVRAVNIPVALWDALDAVSQESCPDYEERSISWLTSLAVKRFLASLQTHPETK